MILRLQPRAVLCFPTILGCAHAAELIGRRLFTCVVVLAVLAGCNRYEYRETCGPTLRTGASAIAWAQADLPHGTIDGRVIDVQTRALIGAQITLDPGGRRVMANDGLFRVDSLPAGEYTLRVRRIGYWQASQSVTLADRGVSILVVMAENPIIMDGCYPTKVRKLWWQFE